LVFTQSNTWTVPAGVGLVDVEVWGAQGGGVTTLPGYGRGGLGADASATLAVVPGQVLTLTVGSTPSATAAGIGDGTAGDGGASSTWWRQGAGGGGASSVSAQGGTWIVAGGGGGAAADGIDGGDSGHAGAGNGRTEDGLGGGGATLNAGGTAGTGGSIATVDLSTCTGIPVPGGKGTAGSRHTGSTGGGVTQNVVTFGGGGGGGGWFGGGGGGAGAYCSTGGPVVGVAGGGGGGSSYIVDTATRQTITQGVNTGNGKVSITPVVDSKAPVSSPEVTAAEPLVGGWSRSAVTVQWHWSDAVSGVDPTSCPATSTETRDGVWTLTGTCSDKAGNTAAAKQRVKIDRTAPTVSLRHPVRRTYHRGRFIVARYRCHDAGVGVATCRGSVPRGAAIGTGKLGKHVFRVVAVDRLGHRTVVRTTYRVVR
jgi:hypothetical protein